MRCTRYYIKKRLILLSIFLFLFTIETTRAQENVIIPKPAEFTVSKENAPFLINGRIIIAADQEFISDAQIFANYLKDISGITVFVVSIKRAKDRFSSNPQILLKYVSTKGIPSEGYILDVSDKKIQIQASSSSGAYYGCMSLLQTIMHSNSDKLIIPKIHVNDQPRFKWRGLMLDVSRTFISFDYLKKTINRMSFYKLNTLHLHLTDDQGWRLEIRKYPLLTQKGAFFDPKYNEPKEFQGFYTQAQMVSLVNYARKKHVTIVPEIEFPGHSQAALHAYPELSVSGKVPSIYPFFAGPNMTTSDVFKPSKKTFRFFEDVIKEVAEIFPSPYIHLGGDEVTQNAWSDCEECKIMMDSIDISDQKHLQGYMMNRVGNYVLSANKRPIGWDEVFGEGVSKKYIIMVWRGVQRDSNGINKEVKAGYDVVLCPNTYLYFDYSYSTTPTRKVYSYEPIPNNVTEKERKHYLGIEGCFWSHIDRTEAKIDYQLFPRVLALAERAWSKKSVKDFNNFYQREKGHKFWLNYFGIGYASIHK